MELLSPKLDIVFKTLFTTKDSQDILSDFLASVLDINPEDIKDIQIQNTELMPNSLEQKYSRLDIAMKLDDKLINVEMQVKKLKDFKERVLFYWAKLYTRDLKESEAYRKLRQTISINILDFNMFDCEECHSIFRLREENRNELLTDKCRFDFLELPKAETDNSIQIKRLRKWLKFFNMKTEEDAEMLTRTDDRIMAKAVHFLKQMSEDDKLREAARIRERALHDEASYIQDAIEDGIAIGIERGRAEGEAKGRAEGEAKGRAEGEAKGRAEGEAKGRAEGIEQGMIRATNELIEKLRSMGVDEEMLKKLVE